MKEWIYKDGSGEYVLTTDPEVANLAADAVEVPHGVDTATICMNEIYFWDTKNNRTWVTNEWVDCDGEAVVDIDDYLNLWKKDNAEIIWQRKPNQTTIDAMNDDKTEEFDTKEMCKGGSKQKHSHYKKGVAHLNVIDPYRIADLYDLHPCAEHIMKKSLCAGGRGHKDLLRDIQDIIDTAERWKEMIEEDNNEV